MAKTKRITRNVSRDSATASPRLVSARRAAALRDTSLDKNDPRVRVIVAEKLDHSFKKLRSKAALVVAAACYAPHFGCLQRPFSHLREPAQLETSFHASIAAWRRASSSGDEFSRTVPVPMAACFRRTGASA
jgi:hypothetical protein